MVYKYYGALHLFTRAAPSVYAFSGRYPHAWIFATGGTEVWTRLYQIGITNNLEELKEDFYVYGMNVDESFEEFIIGEDYLGFLVTRKIKILNYENRRI